MIWKQSPDRLQLIGAQGVSLARPMLPSEPSRPPSPRSPSPPTGPQWGLPAQPGSCGDNTRTHLGQ